MVAILLWVVGLIIVFLFLFYRFVFLRDPERKIPLGDSVVSPADGKIIKSIKLGAVDSLKIKKGLIGKIRSMVPDSCKGGHLVTIMMDFFDVHVQRAPVSGVVTNLNHVDGSFKNAVFGNEFENGLENEKNEITIKCSLGEIKVIQIAGLVARRIECFVKKNQKLNKGERIGRIVMGSQVSLILPREIKLSVEEGDEVKAGESIMGDY